MAYFRIKSNVIRKELWVKGTKALISSQNPPSQAGVPQRHLSESVARHNQVEKACLVVSSGFILVPLKSVNFWSLQSFYHALSSEVNLKPKEEASHISVPCRQPDLGVQDHSWSKVDILETTSSPHSNL